MSVDPLIGTDVRELKADQVPLPRIYWAHRAPPFGTDAFDALDVAADVLGSGRASRLYASLVREQRLAQDVSVFAFPIVGGASIFTLWATARPGVEPEKLEAATLAEVERLAGEGPTDADLERVRNLHAAHSAGSLERISERADRLSMYACLFDEPERINAEVARYAAVDAARVRQALNASVRADNRVTLTYVPAEAAS
jgi:zinc protease